ncbi:MAG: hydantoinase B/oxoprolinase family protein, partial [Leptospiraceae bacterium]|nr:hydantoinase B/oxoprolinase family protein [Leptospiraceae bacterium]
MDASIAQWSFWIDRGGTFTDVIGVHPDGRLESLKLLSELRGGYADAALEGIRRFLGIASDEPIPAGQIREVRMGTTVGTNALLEKTGEPTALAITAGLEDILEIGYQNRPDLFTLHIQKPESLYAAVIPIVERVDAQGRVLQPIDPQQIKNQLDEIYQRGIRSLAIVLMHSYIHAGHEKKIARIARDIGFTQVSVSHEVSPAIRIIRRGDTTVVDAYLSPVLRRYLHQLRRDLQGVPLYFMQSHGGLTGAEAFRGRDSLLSGPAGGVVGGVAIGAQAGRNRLLGFDMGGTSTDVWHYNGELERAFECEIAGVRLQTPMLDIHTVAAGGGSILSYDDKRLQVGPRSAGADPGPVCYGRGGPLSLTDANVLLGRIQPDFFPALFGADGRQTLDADAVRYHFERRASEIKADSGVDRGMYEIARGYFDIAITHMAGAVKKISVERGYNPEEYTLCCFGGAGGQHACALADRLGIREILVHPLAGVLSAYGIGLADWRCLKETYIGLPIFECSLEDLVFAIDGLKNEGRQWLHEQGIAESLNTRHSVRYVTRVHMKYAGSDTILDVAWNEIPAMVSEFESHHRRLFGFDRPENPIILAKLVVETIGTIAINEILESTTESMSTSDTNAGQIDTDPPEPARYVQMYIDAPAMVPLFTVASIQDGRTIQGPAVVSAPNDTLVIDPGWQAVREANACIRLTKVAIDSATIDNPNFEKQPTDSPLNKISTVDSENYANQVTLNRTDKNPADIARVNEAYRNNRTHDDRTRFDPVRLEIFHHLFRSIAGEMGAVLRQTGMSVNIKERLDFSCALFDERGRMIANAPHIP